MSLAWYINRLMNMNSGEICHRVVEKGKKIFARRRLEGWQRYASAGGVPVLPGIKENVSGAAAPLRRRIAEAAQSIKSGRFSSLGIDWPRQEPENPFPSHIWRFDPVSGDSWPGAEFYCFDIPYRHERKLGDIKYVWEYNRLQLLQPLAAHALLADDEESVQFIEAAVTSWYAANPPFRGVAWNSGIELALRAISLLLVSSLCGDKLPKPLVNTIRTILAAHVLWLERYPSRYSSANNHLVAEAAGLFLTILAMPELEGAGREACARQVLIAEAQKQILADGVGAEQSPSYGAFTAELLLLSALVAHSAGKPFADSFNKRLRCFAEFIDWSADSQGRVPTIGDDDEGRVISLTLAEPNYATAVKDAITGCSTANISAPSSTNRGLRDALFNVKTTTTKVKLEGIKSFAQGGYTVVHCSVAGGRPMKLIFDHGPLGYLSIAAHGHADALSLLVDFDNEPLFVDPGTYLYHSGGAWRDWFRGTRAHNTLNIEGKDQSTMAGAFNWRTKANARLEEVREGENWLIRAAHDGYRKPYGVYHEREIQGSYTGFSICDRLLGKKTEPLPVELVFQLAIDVEALQSGNILKLLRNGAQVAEMLFDENGTITIAKGGNGYDGGWISPAFGRKEAAWRVSWCGIVSPESDLLTKITFREDK